MDRHEAKALLEGAGVGLADADVDELVRRTEGWPVGLYLAALAVKAGGPRTAVRPAFTGDDRFMADYLRSELLAHLPQPRVAFLTRTAVLDRMSGPLCDAVLAADRSRLVLESLEGSNLLVVPLDRHREWYRYHHLFRELLQAELDRREPELIRELHARAAAWCEANGLPEMAIDHAQAAEDADRVARLVAILASPPTPAAASTPPAGGWHGSRTGGWSSATQRSPCAGPGSRRCWAGRRGPSAGRPPPSGRRPPERPPTAAPSRAGWP
jgi:LuxR family maltose regulon positive regulatory protein